MGVAAAAAEEEILAAAVAAAAETEAESEEHAWAAAEAAEVMRSDSAGPHQHWCDRFWRHRCRDADAAETNVQTMQKIKDVQLKWSKAMFSHNCLPTW
jgi:hypothetical protein